MEIAQSSLSVKSRAMLFCGLFIVAGVMPLFTHAQFITGPIVNAVLFTAAMALGPFEAVMIGLIPSTMALASGTLPLPLAPMVPFITIGNALLVCVFHYSKKAGFFEAVLLASVVKFVFLAGTVSLLMETMLKSELVAKLSIMMSWPQLATALIGGVIAYSINKKFIKS